jgi:hypothetical protein
MKWLSFLIGSILVLISVSAYGEFIKYPAVKQVSNLGKYLSDIESHVDYSKLPRANYRSNDQVTWAHESTHAINSVIRNKYGNNTNAIYLLYNDAIVLREPPVTLSDVAKIIPLSLRGMSYNLYLKSQTRYWNGQPLYILDELSAYTNGTLVGMELNLNRSESTLQTFEFVVYAICLAATVENYNRQASIRYDDTELKKFIKLYIERTMVMYKQLNNHPSMNSDALTSYLNVLKTSNDTKQLREFIRWYFSKEWAQKVFGF